jgi:predicted metal-dependent enzyme (double-stranded beta helix superfamily)
MNRVHPALRSLDPAWLRRLPAGEEPVAAERLTAVTADLAARPDVWRPVVRHDPLDRWYELLLWTPALEVWLIGWAPGQETPPHDHGGAAGALTVAEGALLEEVFDRAGRVAASRTLTGPGQGRGFGPAHVHRVGNRGAVDATSVHAYSPPDQPMRRFAPAGGVWRPVEEPAQEAVR